MQRILLKYMSDRGCQAVVVRSIPDALDRLAHDSFNFTVIDLEHESMTAPNILSDLKLQRGDPGTVIALTSDHPRAPSTVGIDRFVGKSSIEPDLDRALHALVETSALVPRPSANGGLTVQTSREMSLWRSKRMHEGRGIIEEAAGVDVTVPITGETGAGKEAVARAIHALSSGRAGGAGHGNWPGRPRGG